MINCIHPPATTGPASATAKWFSPLELET